MIHGSLELGYIPDSGYGHREHMMIHISGYRGYTLFADKLPFWADGGKIEPKSGAKFHRPKPPGRWWFWTKETDLPKKSLISSYLFHFFGKNSKVLGICGIYGYIKSVPGSTTRGAQDKLFPYAASAVASWVETAELAEVARDYEKQCKEVG